ncbi:DUF4227 family protein [Paenibacillus sp. NFR01]|uniref:DUF4227 family protein n=1 Tax=Paenibacillus sp. NFR01 TaxID=1566279 RepID=UPI0008B46F8E|nr:DUF4227 family protein [Paenibacillus sp. NFR01]SET55780.1 Protein of unknown function [Paenibacillus sp. NFR01]
MILSVPKTVKRLYFMLLLVVISSLLYYGLNWLDSWLAPIQRSEIPEGTAVRAFEAVPGNPESLSVRERLLLYYLTGE